MDQILLYSSCFVAILSLLVALNARARVIQIKQSVKDLDWDSLANLTGDIATVKKTIQTLNGQDMMIVLSLIVNRLMNINL